MDDEERAIFDSDFSLLREKAFDIAKRLFDEVELSDEEREQLFKMANEMYITLFESYMTLQDSKDNNKKCN